MHTTDAIVLKKIGIREADAAFLLYTKEFGKVRAIAQGIKKEEAKLKGHLEPMNLATVSFVLGASGEWLTHAELKEYWVNIRADIEKYRVASYLLGLVNMHCFEGAKDAALWELILGALRELNEASPINSQFTPLLEARFLAAFGYGGETDIRILGSVVSKGYT